MKTKEERFIELMRGHSVQISSNTKLARIIWFDIDGKWLIVYNQKSYYTQIYKYRIWYIFVQEFDMKYEDIQSFMKDMLFKHFKIKGTTPWIEQMGIMHMLLNITIFIFISKLILYYKK